MAKKYFGKRVDEEIRAIVEGIVESKEFEFCPNAWDAEDLVVNMYCLVAEEKPGCLNLLSRVCDSECAGIILKRMIREALKRVYRHSEYLTVIEMILEVSKIEPNK